MENFVAVGGRKEGGRLSPKIIQEIPTFSLQTGKHKIFWEFYQTLHLYNLFTE